MSTKGLYSDSFWSPEDESVSMMNEHFHDSIKSMESVLSFYKERANIEEEYARKLASLSKKTHSITKYENGTLRASLETLFRETKQLSSSHVIEASKITEIYKSLEEFIDNQRGGSKSIETGMNKLVKYKQSMESKANVAKKKYETSWQRLNSCRTEQILMDDSEASRMQSRITKLTETMTLNRSEYYKIVANYNELHKVFVEEWPKACVHYQKADEAKIKFMKENIWEYANAVSSSCLLDDQSSENIRLSLEKCSVTKDLREFVDKKQTGTNIYAPLEFIDFVKGQTDIPRSVEDVRILRETVLKSGTITHASSKKNPPPKLTEAQEAQADFLDRRKQTFKELEEQNEQEENKSDNYSNPSVSSGSKVMSELSQLTADTVYSDEEMDVHVFSNQKKYHQPVNNKKEFTTSVQSDHPTVYSNPLLESIRSDKPTRPLSIDAEARKEERSKRASKSSLKLKEYFAQVNLGNNSEKFRDSMQQVNPIEALKSEEDIRSSSLGNILKKKLMSLDANKKKESERDLLSMVPLPEEQLRKKERSKVVKEKTSDVSSNHRHTFDNTVRSSSGQLHKSKSATTLKNKFLTANNLPLESSEGYKVIKYTKAQYSYTAEIDQELSFKKRDVLLILHMQPDGWWFAENLNSGASGLAPSNYLLEI